MKYGLYPNLSNEDYHSDNGFLSSSRIKLILDSPEMYHRKYILKTVPNEHKDAFDVGTAIHTRILENHLYDSTVTHFGGIRRGKIWDEFKAANEGKLILGDLQKMQVDRMYKSFLNSELGPLMISGGEAELSLFTELEGHKVKTRSDYINREKRVIYDVKSTSGVINEDKFRYNLESKSYGYDLQAALYVDAYTKQDEGDSEYEFIWIVISKDHDEIKFFKASTELIQQGREKYKKALALIDQYEAAGWDFKKGIIEVFPSNHSFLGEF